MLCGYNDDGNDTNASTIPLQSLSTTVHVMMYDPANKANDFGVLLYTVD